MIREYEAKDTDALISIWENAKAMAHGRPFYERYGFVFEEEYLHEPSGQVTFKMAMPMLSKAV